MQQFRLANESDRARLVDVLYTLDMEKPLVVKITNASGKRRAAQNSLNWLWCKYVGDVNGQTKDQVHAENKLVLGVPILSASDPQFGADWSVLEQHCNWEFRIRQVSRMDVTSRFTIRQMTEYLGEFEMRYAGEGIALPHPEDRYYEAMGLAQ